MNNILIVFARVPTLGKVKTRLATIIGNAKALNVYTHLLNLTRNTAAKSTAKVIMYWSDKTAESGVIQTGNDLGERMYNALSNELMPDAKICLIGTDSPGLSVNIIKQAYKKLDNNDVVFGPSLDGGYYLVACKNKVEPSLFLNKIWSHNNVLNEALSVCKSLGLKTDTLTPLMDIDTIENYNNWQSQL